MARAIVLGLWLYYLAFSLVAPPIVTDAHLYDLARLYVIRQGGLFHNDAVAIFTQLAFPWTFDAVHWPFVWVGAGYALPSFACFTGLLVITYLAVRDRYGADVGWVTTLALFALPTLIYQATSVKSDVAVLFGVFCWFHAMRRFRFERRSGHLVWAALALGFAAGAKTSGIPLAGLLGIVSLWLLRREPRLAARWLACLAVAGVLFGSVETYVANVRVFGNVLGPDGLGGVRNGDGVVGAVANAIRHAAYNVDLGTDVLAGRKWIVSTAMERWCRELLATLGWSAKGVAPWSRSDPLDFVKSGYEAQDGFGPLGTIAMVLVPVVLVRRAHDDPAWRLAAVAAVTFAWSAYAIGFGLWVNRFLMLPYTLGALAAVLYAVPAWKKSRPVAVCGMAVLTYSAVVLPAFSFSRRPIDLWRSLHDRDAELTLEMPAYLPVLRAVRTSMETCPGATWVVTTHPTPQFLFFDLLRDREVLVRPAAVTAGLLASVGRAHEGRAVRVLALERDVTAVPELVDLKSFPGTGGTHIYAYGDGGCAEAG
jgi:hypothetical protein